MITDYKIPLIQSIMQNIDRGTFPDDYPTEEECDKIEEEYRNAHWCPKCLAMFEEECICEYEEYEEYE